MLRDYISIRVCNPLKTWSKARKYFKRPKAEIHFFKDLYYNCPFANVYYTANILDIYCSDVMWKDKWNSPRHERDPFIWVCFFQRFGFSINFKVWWTTETTKEDAGMYYWEYLLDFLYYRKDINIVNTWYRYYNVDKEEITLEIPTKSFSLKKKYLK